MTILTQNLTIVNYDFVKTITAMAGEAEISKDKKVDAFELIAELTDGTEVSLGIFFTENEVEQVIDDITKWLNEINDYHRLFKIPEYSSQELQLNSFSDEKTEEEKFATQHKNNERVV